MFPYLGYPSSNQTHVLRQPKLLFSALLSAVTIDLPRSCLVRIGIALMGKPSICDPPIMSFSRSNARYIYQYPNMVFHVFILKEEKEQLLRGYLELPRRVTRPGFIERLRANGTVRLQIHVLRQPIFFFSSLLSAVTVGLPRSCLVRNGMA